jgi:serine/threonine protein phosphatase PrpC
MILITEKQIQNKRPYQEDSIRLFQDEDWIIAIVCDGMGGHAYGKEASNDAANFALSQLKEQSQQPVKKGDVFASFTGVYYWHNHVPRGYTTYASIIIHKPTMNARIEHLGDSSVSLVLRDGVGMKLLTPHHVGYYGGIVKCVPNDTTVDALQIDLNDFDEAKILVFSDGLDPAFRSKVYDYESSLDKMFELAIYNGSTDNISAYMLEIKSEKGV